MSDPAVLSAVMSELAARRWRGHVAIRCARTLAERADELPPTERRRLIAALTEHTESERP
jgi:hypothetical protein